MSHNKVTSMEEYDRREALVQLRREEELAQQTPKKRKIVRLREVLHRGRCAISHVPLPWLSADAGGRGRGRGAGEEEAAGQGEARVQIEEQVQAAIGRGGGVEWLWDPNEGLFCRIWQSLLALKPS